MKHIITLCVTLWIASTGFAQDMEYRYDEAGNRIQRLIYVWRPAKKAADGTETAAASAPLEDKAGEFEFTLFPNPTTDVLNISVNELFLEEKNKEVIVSDMNGKVLMKQVVRDRVTNLDFSAYTPGSYLVRMLSEGQQVREWKIIRE